MGHWARIGDRQKNCPAIALEIVHPHVKLRMKFECGWDKFYLRC